MLRGLWRIGACPPGAVRVLAERADLPASRPAAVAAWACRDESGREHPSIVRGGARSGQMERWASRPGTPMLVLLRLSGHPDPYVRGDAAANSGFPARQLRRLAADAAYQIRMGVARNRACPPGLLQELAGDGDEEVRLAVGRQPRLRPGDAVLDVRGA